MSKEILMQFVGFESKRDAREYTFTVREDSTDAREFTITISHAAFNERRVRFQDAPDVCALRLKRELATCGNHPSECHFHITDAELEDYRATHSVPKRGTFGHARNSSL